MAYIVVWAALRARLQSTNKPKPQKIHQTKEDFHYDITIHT